MTKKPDRVETREFPAEILDGGGNPIKGKVVVTSTYREYQIRGRLIVDFAILQASGELRVDDLHTLEHGYPNGIILFMGKSESGINGKTVCIGIKTGMHVYPKNMFWLTEATVVAACVPTDEPPHTIEPY